MTEKQDAYILVINCGSSSLKFSMYHLATLMPTWSGHVSHIGTGRAELIVKTNQDELLIKRNGKFPDLSSAVQEVIQWLKKEKHYPIKAIGHQLVQRGPKHRQPALITSTLLKTLRHFVYLAPNHLPDELLAIKAFSAAFPNVPQVACFDTDFHSGMPSFVKYYPLLDKPI